MAWSRSETKRYGGEDYMAKRQRLSNEEQAKKARYDKLSLWKKIKHHASEIRFKVRRVVYLYWWHSIITVPITAAIIFFILWIKK